MDLQELVIVGFFVAAVLGLGLSVFTRKLYGRWDAVILSACLCATWTITKLIAHGGDAWLLFSTVGDWDTARSMNSTIDAVVASIGMVLCTGKAEPWKIGFVATVWAKLGVDLIYAYAALNTGIKPGTPYQVIQDALYALEFVFLSWPGGWAVANNYRRGCIFDWRRIVCRLPSRIRPALLR